MEFNDDTDRVYLPLDEDKVKLLEKDNKSDFSFMVGIFIFTIIIGFLAAYTSTTNNHTSSCQRMYNEQHMLLHYSGFKLLQVNEIMSIYSRNGRLYVLAQSELNLAEMVVLSESISTPCDQGYVTFGAINE